MCGNIKKLFLKYKSFILYAFFGVCTTLVNIAVYTACARGVGLATIISTVIAWIAAVLFAYVTNRRWVFESNKQGMAIAGEIISFFGCRLLTGFLDVLIMFVFVDLAGWNDIVIKAGSNILVIVINYVASKLIIFRKDG